MPFGRAACRRRVLPWAPRVGSVAFGFPFLGGLSGLAKAVTFAVDLEDVAAMSKAVQQGRRHAFALEDTAPVAEGQIAGHQDAGPLVAIGEDLEEQFRTAAAEGQVSKFVNGQEVELVELPEEVFQPVLLLRLLQGVDQGRRREEPHPFAGPASRLAQGDCQMRFARTGIAQETEIKNVNE